jgi:hypothetical protein
LGNEGKVSGHIYQTNNSCIYSQKVRIFYFSLFQHQIAQSILMLRSIEWLLVIAHLIDV